MISEQLRIESQLALVLRPASDCAMTRQRPAAILVKLRDSDVHNPSF